MRKAMALTAVFLLALAVGTLAFIRLAPLDPARWHVSVDAGADEDFVGGARRVIDGGVDRMARLDAALRALPRTSILAGSADAGHVTYVTRSAVFGFPDMTTVQLVDGQIRMFARLRFGRSDLGVNRKRLEGLIAAVQ